MCTVLVSFTRRVTSSVGKDYQRECRVDQAIDDGMLAVAVILGDCKGGAIHSSGCE